MRIRANSFTSMNLYQLKKMSGEPADLYIRGAVSQDVETGKVTYPEIKHKIKKVVILPIEIVKQFTPAQNFATAGRQFEYGGLYTLSNTFILVDFKDLPKNYEYNTEDNFVMNHRRFVIKRAQDYREIQAALFILEELKGQFVNEIFEVKQKMTLTDSIETDTV